MKKVFFMLWIIIWQSLFGQSKASLELENKLMLKIDDLDISSTKLLEIITFSHNISVPVDSPSQKLTAPKNFHDFTITRYADPFTSYFYDKCTSRQQIPVVTISYYKKLPYGNSTYKYMQVQLRNVTITSVSVNGAEGGEVPTETITLSYQQMSFSISVPSRVKGKNFETQTFSYDLMQY